MSAVEPTDALPSSAAGEGGATAAAVAATPTAATTSSTEKPAAPVPMFQMSNAVSFVVVVELYFRRSVNVLWCFCFFGEGTTRREDMSRWE